MSSDLIGHKLGSYEIVEFLGYEGIAEVYKGRQPGNEQPVLIRLVGRGLDADPVWSTRFRRDAKAIAALKHANISPAYDFGEALGGHYMVTDILDGSTMADLIADLRAGQRTPTPEDVTFLGRQVAAALDHAHTRGVIHHNLNPDRILITRSGQAIIADFGLALLLTRGADEHAGGAAFGAPQYMAPEQLADFLAGSPASDIYSLGAILYEMLTGELPFELGSEVDEALRIPSENVPDPRTLNPNLPPAVTAVLLKALAKSPRDRFKSAMQLASQLEWAYGLREAPPPKEAKARKPRKPSPDQPSPPQSHELPTVRMSTTQRLMVVRRGPSWQEERREKARLRAELRRYQREESARIHKERRAARRAKTREFFARWGRTLVTLGIVLVVAAGAIYGLQAAGVISVDIDLPDAPPALIPNISGPATEFASTRIASAPTDPPAPEPTLTAAPPATAAPVLTPTPILSTDATPVPPLQFTPLGVLTTAFRVYDGAAMQFVPAGQFLMGTNDPQRSETARPQHPVILSDYWIDRTEVTNQQYSLCVDEGPCEPPTDPVHFDDPAFANYPVVFVSYGQAAAYCLWLAGETGHVIGLPTEAQWEKAASWDPETETARTYPWGNQFPTADRMRFFGGPDVRPASPVGSHPSGASAYGAHDMAGNVWEWVADWFDRDYYKRTGMAVDPTGPASGTARVTRGGSWRHEPTMGQTTVRNPADPSINGDALGFRCAMTGSRPDADSGIVLTPLDLSHALESLIDAVASDAANDSGVLAEWSDSLTALSAALQSSQNSEALRLITERIDRLATQQSTGLLAPTVAFRLERALLWMQEQVEPGVPIAPTPTP